jgi:prophage DNA circulation protein
MSWRDEIKGTATFRSASFRVRESEHSGGRRAVIHEFPYRDVPYVEDMGAAAGRFDVEAYVIGDDYLTERDAVLDAINVGGPGNLIHPYYGTLVVAVLSYAIKESTEEGGWARISISFVRSEARPAFPVISRAPIGQINASADSAQTAASAAYGRRLVQTVPEVGAGAVTPGRRFKRLPTFAFTSVSGVVRSFGSSLQSALAPVAASSQDFASLKRQIDGIVLDADRLVRDPLTLAARFYDIGKSLITLPQTPRLGVKALLTAYGFVPSTARPAAVTPIREAEQVNYDATYAFVQSFAITEAARLAVQAAAVSRDGAVTDGGFDSYEDAIDARDSIVDKLDAQADAANDDEAYAALLQLRADLIAAVPGEHSTLPHLLTVTPPISIPSLVLCYQFYGDIDREADLLARNHVRHPGFVLGGRPLQVLSRD